MSIRPWQEMSQFERLLDNFGRTREAAGDAAAEERWTSARNRLEEAADLERRLITMYNEMEIAANANRCIGCGELGCGGACAH